MKLSEVSTDGALKILVYGNAGSGKTCFASSMPYPILYLDFDNKVDSAALFHKNDPARLDNIDVRVLAKNLVGSPIEQMERIIKEELIPQQKNGSTKFKTLVIDSLTTFSAAVLQHIVATNPGVNRVKSAQGAQPGMQDYGILRREFQRLVPGLLGLPCNVVMLGHISVDKDEHTGAIVRGPMMDGSFAQQLPIYFKEVWRSYRDDKGKHWAQTQSDYQYQCRSQIPGIANPIELSYQSLAKHL